jgi:prepilin-type N-terminal cleavage/methylation domain-containing protein
MTHDGYIMIRNRLSFLIKPRRYDGANNNKGFTLIELIVVVTLIGVLATMAIPAYSSYIDKSKTFRAMADIRTLSTEINGVYIDKGNYPNSLSDSGMNRGGFLDPWKNPYIYTNIAISGTPLVGFLNKPLNQNFDIYSKGANGSSATAYGDPSNQDDIVNFNDGTYVGLRE